MAKYAVKVNPPYTQEGSTGKLVMNIPRRTEYSIVDTKNGDRVIADIRDTVTNPKAMAFLICDKLNN